MVFADRLTETSCTCHGWCWATVRSSLPRELAADQDRLRRFEKEARSASALNHPNIVTIYDIGSADSVSYIAMERVEGKTLRELLSAGPLPSKSSSESRPIFAAK